MDNDDVVQLGGNIELSGFSQLDGGTMIILKKIIGNYAKKMSDKSKNFEKLSLHVKKVHENKFELNAKLMDNGQAFTSSSTEYNVFVAVDNALKSVMNSKGLV